MTDVDEGQKTPLLCRQMNISLGKKDVDEGQKTPLLCVKDYMRQSSSPKLPMAVDTAVR